MTRPLVHKHNVQTFELLENKAAREAEERQGPAELIAELLHLEAEIVRDEARIVQGLEKLAEMAGCPSGMSSPMRGPPLKPRWKRNFEAPIFKVAAADTL